MTRKVVEERAVLAPLRAWLRVGNVQGPSRMGVRPALRPATLAVTLGPGDVVHLVGPELYAVRADGTWRASLWPPGSGAPRHVETLSAFAAAGVLSASACVEAVLDHAAASADADAAVHPHGTPDERVVDVSPALALATRLARDVAERLADAGVVARLSGREARVAATARACVSISLGDVAVSANAFGYVTALLSPALPCAEGKVERPSGLRVVRLGSGPGGHATAASFLATLAADIADACGHAPAHAP